MDSHLSLNRDNKIQYIANQAKIMLTACKCPSQVEENVPDCCALRYVGLGLANTEI